MLVGMKIARQVVAGVLAVGLGSVLLPIASAVADDCTSTCNEKRSTCDVGCDHKKIVCIVQCGLPVLPGYNACTQKCSDDQGRCTLQCQAEQKICDVRCKVP